MMVLVNRNACELGKQSQYKWRFGNVSPASLYMKKVSNLQFYLAPESNAHREALDIFLFL